MTDQEVRDYLIENGYEDTLLYDSPGYSEAFVGVTTDGIAIYDYERMVQCLMDEGMDEIDAIEWIEFNCVGCKGEGMPMIINVGNPNYASKEEALDKPAVLSEDTELTKVA